MLAKKLQNNNKLIAFLLSVSLIASWMLTFAIALSPESQSLKMGMSSPAQYQNAIYIYMCGSTLETKNSIATKNLETILKANIPPQTAVVIETGGTRKWRGYDIPNDELVRYEVKNGSLVEISQEENSNMGDSKTLASFLKFCKENYSAENTTLLFWNHGAGSAKGVCLDENYNMDGLSTKEMNEALDETDSHFTNVCFDACLMANFETARVLAEHADTFVASQEIEPATGWDYKSVIESLGKQDFAEQILNSYSKQCEDNSKDLWCLSKIDLKQFSKVETAFRTFVRDTLIKKAESGQLQEIVQTANDTTSFGQQNGKSDFIDLDQFAEKLGASQLAQSIKEITTTVHGSHSEAAFGMNIFFPFSCESSLKNYINDETDETYATFLAQNFINSKQNANPIIFTNSGSTDGSTMNFQISTSSLSNVQSVAYDVYQVVEGEPENCLGFDNDVQTDGKGTYTIDFSAKWVTLNGHLLSCEPIEKKGDTSIFSSPILLNDERGSLRFAYNSKTKVFNLQGFVSDEANDTHGRLQEVNDGDTITILSEKFASNVGEETVFSPMATIEVNDGLQFSTTTLPDGKYEIYGIVTDIFGNEHTTQFFLVNLQDGEVVSASVE